MPWGFLLACLFGSLILTAILNRSAWRPYLFPDESHDLGEPKPMSVKWAGDAVSPATATAPATSASPTTSQPPEVAAPPATAKPTAGAPPFAIDLAKPIRITWPLDVGPDPGGDRLCLRARQGANELLTTTPGDALYAVRLDQAARCRVWFRARYVGDAVGNTECNNSLVLAVDSAQPTLIGNDNVSSQWAWRRGPRLNLAEGLHWLRLELREDGPVLDRMALVDEKERPKQANLDALEPVTFGGLAGEAEPSRPQHRIQDVEIFAQPTGSLVIGTGHANEVSVCASWQGRTGDGFEGTLSIHSVTAKGVTANGERRLACGPTEPFARSVVELDFPPDTPRRVHKVIVSVADAAGTVVFRQEMRFVRPFAWAFLGPFPDGPEGARDERLRSGSVVDASVACERSPMLLARLQDPTQLKLPAAGVAWKIVDDGSCCDWTGAIDLQKVYGLKEYVCAYAVTWLDSRSSASRRLVSLQADDAAWLWVNGSFLVQMPMELPREANRLWTSGALRRGPNPVVIKLTQARAYWAFHFEIVDWHWQGRKGPHDRITGLDPAQWPGR